jgi:hypothetical protein
MSTRMLATITNTAAASTKPMISGRLPWSIASTESWPMPPMPPHGPGHHHAAEQRADVDAELGHHRRERAVL